MSAETPRTNLCNIALIGTKFMGRAHSNAYLKVDKFFDLPCQPVMPQRPPSAYFLFIKEPCRGGDAKRY